MPQRNIIIQDNKIQHDKIFDMSEINRNLII